MRKNLLDRNLPAAAVQNVSRVLALVLVVVTLFSVTCFSQQARLIKDVNTDEEAYYGEYSMLTPAVGIMYFVSREKELWKTTGTTGGTVKLKSLNSIRSLIHVGSTAYFLGEDVTHGVELWKSNGTAAGTVMVKDILPGVANDALLSELTSVGNRLFFAAQTSAGKELWISDGTATGTRMVKDIFPKAGSSNPNELTNVNGLCYFSANDGQHGYELWKSDGTAAGTVLVKDIRPEYRSGSQPTKLVDVNGTLFFTAITSNGRELWKSNGTAEGTQLVYDINNGGGSSSIDNMTNVSGKLMFSANDGIHGQELWRSDGTWNTTHMVKDMTPGPRGSQGTDYISEPIDHFANINGILYYQAYQNNVHKIWRSDGTEQGTIALQNVGFVGWGPSAPRFSRVNNAVFYFNAIYNESTGRTKNFLWKIDPSSTTPVVVREFGVPIDEYYVSLQQSMVTFNNSLIIANLEGGGYKLFRYTGSTGQVTVLKDVYNSTMGSNPTFVAAMNNTAFFTTYNEMNGDNGGLFQTDGTSAGTLKLVDYPLVLGTTKTHFFYSDGAERLNVWKTDGVKAEKVFGPHPDYRIRQEGIAVGNLIYFTSYPEMLWRSDGTAAGTFPLKPVYWMQQMYKAGDLLIYIHVNASNEVEIWRSNGTVAGTLKLKTLANHNWYSWRTHNHAYLNGVLYFLANDETYGVEVWRTDGTAAGTYMFADLRQADADNEFDFDIATMAVFKKELYISALADDDKWYLYKSNGVNAPAKMMELFPVGAFAPADDKMFMFVGDRHPRPEAIINAPFLYTTDGTAAGTQKVSNELLSTYDLDYTVINNVIYCNTEWTEMLYRSDGTSCGSFIVNTGVAGAAPMIAINNSILFRGVKEPYGAEPYILNTLEIESPCAAEVAVAETSSATQMQFMTQSPNPFTSDFSLTINGSDGEVTEVSVYTFGGRHVETIAAESNTKYNLGSNWPQGLYIVKVNKGGAVETQRVFKK
jgi:ELWxxDGT repeat protein